MLLIWLKNWCGLSFNAIFGYCGKLHYLRLFSNCLSWQHLSQFPNPSRCKSLANSQLAAPQRRSIPPAQTSYIYSSVRYMFLLFVSPVRLSIARYNAHSLAHTNFSNRRYTPLFLVSVVAVGKIDDTPVAKFAQITITYIVCVYNVLNGRFMAKWYLIVCSFNFEIGFPEFLLLSLYCLTDFPRVFYSKIFLPLIIFNANNNRYLSCIENGVLLAIFSVFFTNVYFTAPPSDVTSLALHFPCLFRVIADVLFRTVSQKWKYHKYIFKKTSYWNKST